MKYVGKCRWFVPTCLKRTIIFEEKNNYFKLLESSEESFLHFFCAKADQISSQSKEHNFLIQNFQIYRKKNLTDL